MARKSTKTNVIEQTGGNNTKHEAATDVRMQMETLRRELHQLAQRAEIELENNLRELPAPILGMVSRIAAQTDASAVGVWLDSEYAKPFTVDGVQFLSLTEADKLQCGLALSGREMCFDFSNARVYLPVVIFENPIAVAVLELPSMCSLNYEAICAIACRELKALRAELKECETRASHSIHAAS